VVAPTEKPHGTIIHCHGNAGILVTAASWPPSFTGLGQRVPFRLPGYGKKSGLASERGLARDARAAYEFVRAQYGDVERPPICCMAIVGGAVAARLALEKKPRGAA